MFDRRVLVLACLTNSSLEYRGAHLCMQIVCKQRRRQLHGLIICLFRLRVYCDGAGVNDRKRMKISADFS